ncbi:hypothetical protein CVU76_01180 [Candidatus Dojkabacteria bacterium HGW-Dojkabacteria-1]|uniref:Glycosyltransferase RgtA/B/C/D-like domain-containing protein n=1 Tax=Candidatus Dojkabacteria bacterium HGW-Dojkabacteria-1 TaxID=2013761 RepID=A0A2N2F337_9BACT|nr:MAG: hypothetical protein CVU76_01180 [Candidatus Dojkabacteria bacterium HGW-Dojkabacteria-1]
MSNYIYTLVPLIIPGLSFVLIALFYAILFKKRITETYFLSTATVIVVLFLTGLLNFKGSLILGYSILLSFSLFSLIYSIKKYLRNRAIIKDIWLIQGLIILALFFSLSLFLNYRRMFISWDEFSHWGSILKNMYNLDALGTFKETSGHVVQTYLEGSSLFQYFWMRPFAQYTEYPAYLASNILYFSIICSFIKKYNFRNILFLFTAILIPLLMEGNFYSSLYVDCIIGLLFGAAFIYYHYYKYENSLFGVIIVLATISVLTLVKDMGFVYSVVLISLFSVDFLLFKKDYLRIFFAGRKSSLQKSKLLLLLFSPVLVTFLITLFWKLNIRFTNTDAGETVVTKGLQLVSENIVQMINGNLQSSQLNIINTVQDALINKPIFSFYFSYIHLFIGTIIVSIALSLLYTKKDLNIKRIIVNFIVLTLGSLSVVFVILITYLFIFTEYEALTLASFGRYIMSYFVGIFFAYSIFIILEPKDELDQNRFSPFLKESSTIIKYFLTFSLYFLLIFNTRGSINTHFLNARESVHSSIATREDYGGIISWTKYIPEEKEGELYIIAQADKGFVKLVTIYNLIPTEMEWITDYSVSTQHYYPEYPWTKIISPEDWEKYVLENYELVYIFEHDENFINLYGQFFDEIRDDSLYQVTKDKNGNLKLLSIQRE